MTRAHKAVPSTPARHSGPASPDRRLSSVFTKRTLTAPVTARSVGILTTFAPTLCGIANFSQALCESLVADRDETIIGVVRLGQDVQTSTSPTVIHEVPATEAADHLAAARALNQYDVVLIQHEFGIYGGDDGEHVLEILEWVRVPVIVVLHTVPASPTAKQRAILERLTGSADAIVAMSETGRQRLLADYRVAPRKLMLIPHGARAITHEAPGAWIAQRRRPTVLSWGLLGPGKGIEWGIDALPSLRTMDPAPRYVVAGQTHPKVLAVEGEAYRESLVQRAESLGVSHMVEFESGYLTNERLLGLVRQADVVLLPYDSSEQVTSGVLVEAIAANVPVVSTNFAHAQELLAGDRGGLLVPHQDPSAIGAALTRILTEPGLAERMIADNINRAAALSWTLVASQYRQLFDALLRRPTAPAR